MFQNDHIENLLDSSHRGVCMHTFHKWRSFKSYGDKIEIASANENTDAFRNILLVCIANDGSSQGSQDSTCEASESSGALSVLGEIKLVFMGWHVQKK
jgi:hypothetical protein